MDAHVSCNAGYFNHWRIAGIYEWGPGISIANQGRFKGGGHKGPQPPSEISGPLDPEKSSKIHIN